MPGPATVKIEVTGIRRLQGALKVLGETEAPFLRDAMVDVGRQTAQAVRGRAKGGIAATVDVGGVRGGGASIRALVIVRHPGSKPMEFGDYYGQRGHRNSPYHAYPKGQRPQPFVGIVHGGNALGEVAPRNREAIEEAIEKEFERLAVHGSDL